MWLHFQSVYKQVKSTLSRNYFEVTIHFENNKIIFPQSYFDGFEKLMVFYCNNTRYIFFLISLPFSYSASFFFFIFFSFFFP